MCMYIYIYNRYSLHVFLSSFVVVVFFYKIIASWTPDETQRKAPTITFNHDLNQHGINSVAPWAKNR